MTPFLGFPTETQRSQLSVAGPSLKPCVFNIVYFITDTWDNKRLPPLRQRQRAHSVWVAAFVDVLAGHLHHDHLPSCVGDDAAVDTTFEINKTGKRQLWVPCWFYFTFISPLLTCGWLRCRCWRWRRTRLSHRPAALSPCSVRDI